MAHDADPTPLDRPLSHDRAVLERGALLVAAGIALVLLAETVASLAVTPHDAGYLARFEGEDARLLAVGFNRSFNQLLAVVFTTVAIVVPLTANTYSVKFLELFVSDRVNRAVLLLFVFAIPNNLWLLRSLDGDYVPVFAMWASLAMALVLPALLVPYLFYLFRFLHPTTLLRRLRTELLAEVETARRRPARARAAARNAAELVEHVASVAVRSVDRADRTTAVETVLVLRQAVEGYWTRKAEMPAAWFAADPATFRGLPADALAEMTAARTAFETKVLSELRQVMSAASPRAHDLVSAAAEVTADLGLSAEARRDPHLAELVTTYFNTFIRLTINRGDVRSVFTLFHQYRRLAEGIAADDPARLERAAFHFQYYAEAALAAKLPFVVETIAHDLGHLVRHAWAQGHPRRDALLARMAAFDAGMAGPPLPGVRKAQAIVMAGFLTAGDAEAAAPLAAVLRATDPALRRRIAADLAGTESERYWEVNDRRVNLDFVPPPERAALAEFFASIDGA
jgi:hypothetical protein